MLLQYSRVIVVVCVFLCVCVCACMCMCVEHDFSSTVMISGHNSNKYPIKIPIPGSLLSYS